MKLKTYLTENETEIVSIGTRDGSEYVYIGEAGNVDQIVLEFERYHDKRVAELDVLEARLNALVREIPADGIDSACEYAVRVARLYHSIKKHKEYLEHYVDVLRRDVCEVETRLADDGVKVIITGSERGSYWTKAEYDNRHKG